MTEANAGVAKLSELLAFRLPTSGKPLGSIVLSRQHAAEVLDELIELRHLLAADAKKKEIELDGDGVGGV